MKWGRPQIGFSTIYGTWSMCWWYTIDVAMRCHTLTGSKWLENIVNCWSSWSVELLQREAHQVWCSYTLPSLRDVHVLHGSYDSRVIIQPIIHITNPSDTNSNHSSSTAHGNISNIMKVESNTSFIQVVHWSYLALVAWPLIESTYLSLDSHLSQDLNQRHKQHHQYCDT